jgi:hypothetical protein
MASQSDLPQGRRLAGGLKISGYSHRMKFILFLQKKWMGRRDQRGLGGTDSEDFACGPEAEFSDEVGLGGS